MSGGRPETLDIVAPLLDMLKLGPLRAREIAAALGVSTKSVTAVLHRLKARGEVKIADGTDSLGSKFWTLGTGQVGFALGECWPMPMEFPPLPVPGTVTTHERVVE